MTRGFDRAQWRYDTALPLEHPDIDDDDWDEDDLADRERDRMGDR